MPADEVERGLALKVTPWRDGRLSRFDRAPDPNPPHQTERHGNQSKDRYKAHQDQIVRRRLETEAEGRKYQCRKCHLRHGVELRYHQWLHWDRLSQQPRNKHRGDTPYVAG